MEGEWWDVCGGVGVVWMVVVEWVGFGVCGVLMRDVVGGGERMGDGMGDGGEEGGLWCGWCAGKFRNLCVGDFSMVRWVVVGWGWRVEGWMVVEWVVGWLVVGCMWWDKGDVGEWVGGIWGLGVLMRDVGGGGRMGDGGEEGGLWCGWCAGKFRNLSVGDFSMVRSVVVGWGWRVEGWMVVGWLVVGCMWWGKGDVGEWVGGIWGLGVLMRDVGGGGRMGGGMSDGGEEGGLWCGWCAGKF